MILKSNQVQLHYFFSDNSPLARASRSFPQRQEKHLQGF